MEEAPRTSVGYGYLALSGLVYCVGVFVSSLSYPTSFEWRYGLISTLMSRKDNPDGYVFSTLALVLGSVLMIRVVTEIYEGLGGRSSRWARTAWILGVIGLSCAAIVGLERMLLTGIVNRVRKLHEIIAGASFILLVLSCALFAALASRRSTPGWRKALPLVIMLTAPIGMLSSQWYLKRYRPALGWVGADWKELDVSIFLSFAFWQWLFVIGLYLTMFMLLRETRPTARGAAKA